MWVDYKVDAGNMGQGVSGACLGFFKGRDDTTYTVIIG